MLTIFLLFTFLLFFIVILVLMWLYDRRRNTIARQEAIKRELNQTFLKSKLEISEKTIMDIRQELHNNMGQLASLIKINLNTLTLQEPQSAGGKIEETMEITQQLINDIKSLSNSLSPGHLTPSGLDEALEAEAALLNKAGRVHVTIACEGNLPVPDQVRTVILFRLSQEIMDYRIKQGKARHLSILLQGLENVLILSFNDDGSAVPDDPAQEYTNGFLSDLDRRTKLINARLHMESIPPGKNGIRIEMPL